MAKITEDTKIDLRLNGFWAMIVSLVVTAFSFAGLYYGLSNKIELLTQRVNLLIENQTTIITKYEQVQTRMGRAELNIKELQTLIGVNTSDKSATLNN